MNALDNGFFKSIKENWFLILFIGGLIVAWTTSSNRLSAVEKEQTTQSTTLGKVQSDQEELRAAVIESKASFIFIKESISELKANQLRK